MKLIVVVSLLLTVFAIVLPLISAMSFTPIKETPAPLTEGSEEPQAPSPYYSPEDPVSDFDDAFTIKLLNGDSVTEMTMSQYLKGAVAAEMPASFAPEALKAQAVAIRTYVLYKMLVSPSNNHPQADICSDSTCCAAWKDESYLREKWGDNYDANAAIIASAVSETNGLYLSYDDAPALAVFHSSSSGKTEDSSEVWSSSLPYLISVDSPESSSSVPNYTSSVTVSAKEFRETISESYPDAQFADDPAGWLGNIEYSDSGRIHSVTVGGVQVSGTSLRSMFSLRSTAVTIETDGSTFTMTSTGYGHGVGMSQYGANVMAQSGDTFDTILAYYYPSTVLKSAADLSLI
ncbi:MAG: stage II sporulation protein D [Oscillospiraceae bacterium]